MRLATVKKASLRKIHDRFERDLTAWLAGNQDLTSAVAIRAALRTLPLAVHPAPSADKIPVLLQVFRTVFLGSGSRKNTHTLWREKLGQLQKLCPTLTANISLKRATRPPLTKPDMPYTAQQLIPSELTIFSPPFQRWRLPQMLSRLAMKCGGASPPISIGQKTRTLRRELIVHHASFQSVYG